MRNFSTAVANDSFFLVDAHWLNARLISRIRCALSLTLESTDGFTTPAEDRVFDDFQSWVSQVLMDLRRLDAPGEISARFDPCFTYHNLNTGKSVVVVAVVQEYDELIYPRVHFDS